MADDLTVKLVAHFSHIRIIIDCSRTIMISYTSLEHLLNINQKAT